MTDIASRLFFDNVEKTIIRQRIQDVEPILERTKYLRSVPQKSDWGRHIAEIPNVILEKWFNEYNEGRAEPDYKIFGEEFCEYVDKKLDDPEWKYLRTDK